MDQVRKILGWIKHQHFWLLCGIVAVVGLVCWNSGSGKLAKEFETNKSAIKGEFDSESQLKSATFHSNDEINKKQEEEIDKQDKSVQATWQQLYDRQRKEVLEWPAALTKEFRDYVEKKQFGDDIPRDLRSNYQNYADGHFETLPKIVGARVMRPGEGGVGGMGGGYGARGGMMMGRGGLGSEGGDPYAQLTPEELADSQTDYLCEWLDQYVVRDALAFPERPSAIAIWVTQEDLWVYRTLLEIIANTNEAAGTDRMANAAIRTIMSLEVGRPAAMNSRAMGRIEIAQALPVAGAEGGAVGPEGAGGGVATESTREYAPGPGMGMGMGMGGRSEYGGPGGTTQMTPEQEKAMLLAGRYLDANGKPIGGDMGLGGAAGGAPVDPAAAPPAVELDTSAPFKRLPVRMVLQMDQRWITHLICECANQPLQVEVTEVRINPADVSGGAGGGGRSFEGGYGGGGRGPGGGGSGGAGSTLQVHVAGQLGTFSQQPNLATVVIQGMIYIFQEPKKDAPQETEAQLTAQ